MFWDCSQAWGEVVRSPVQTAGEPSPPVPTARHVEAVQSRDVIWSPPVGKVDSTVQVSAPEFATLVVMTVGSELLLASPVASASQVVLVGQVISPTVVVPAAPVGRASLE